MSLSGKVVFSAGLPTDLDLYVLDLSSGEMDQLTTGFDQVNDMPRWSPDGSHIAFIRYVGGIPELWTINADGTSEKQISKEVKFHQFPCWHPDGDSILCSANYGSGEEIDIWQIPLNGGEPEKVVSSDGYEMEPCWSPDGKHILVSSPRAGNHDIWEYEIGSGNWKQLTEHPAKDHAPRYSPDGSKIAFVSSREGWEPGDFSGNKIELPKPGDTDIWLMNRDGSDKQKLTSNQGSDKFVCWSPDGQYLLYCADSDSKTQGERFHYINLENRKETQFDYDREEIETEIASPEVPKNIFSLLLPDALKRKFISASYFGTERFPDWKA